MNMSTGKTDIFAFSSLLFIPFISFSFPVALATSSITLNRTGENRSSCFTLRGKAFNLSFSFPWKFRRIKLSFITQMQQHQIPNPPCSGPWKGLAPPLWNLNVVPASIPWNLDKLVPDIHSKHQSHFLRILKT